MNAKQKLLFEDVHSYVATRMLEQLYLAIIPWQEKCYELPIYANGYPMDYLNILLLGTLPYPRKVFFTRLQIKRNNLRIKHGEKGFTIVGLRHGQARRGLYYTTVYHPINLEGVSNDQLPAQRIVRSPAVAGENILSSMPKLPRIIPGDWIYYNLLADTITFPKKNDFKDQLDIYYSMLFYALAQCTGHPSRMNRSSAIHRRPDDDKTYGLESLITEMVAGYLANFCSISPSYMVIYHSNYDNWIPVIKANKRMIVTAAFYAQEAINFILNRNPLLNPIQTGLYTPITER